MMKASQMISEDPLSWISRIANRLHVTWMRWTYPFASVGRDFRVAPSCDLKRSIAPYIKIGNAVWLDKDVWVNIPVAPAGNEPVIVFDEGVKISRRCVISAKNRIHFERDVIFAPSVLVMDHNHAFEDVSLPVAEQGITEGGTIRIEAGCWIGYGAAIVSGQGHLVIGKNSIIGANSVVTRSIPANSVVSGNPGRIVKSYDPSKGRWVLGGGPVRDAVKTENEECRQGTGDIR